MSQMKDFSGKTNCGSFQTRFGEERNFLAKSFKMGTAWSYYKVKRREKKELKRCVDFSYQIWSFCRVFIREKTSRFLGAIKLKRT